MTEDPENIARSILRRIDEKIDRLGEDVRDMKQRLTALEAGVANLAATEAGHYASVAVRADRTEERPDRIERRLDLREA